MTCFDTLAQFRVFKIVGDLAERFCRRFGPDEIDLDPRNPVLGLHHFRHIVDGPVAHDGVEIRGMGVGKLVVRGIAAEGGDNGDAAVIQDAVDFKGIAAYVVFAEQVDLVFAFFDVVIEAHDVRENAVVGNVVPRGLADALVALATEPENIDPELFLHLSRHRVHVVADKSHRASGEDADGLGFEQIVGFLDGRPELLLASEHDVFFLHVRGKAVRHKVFIGRPVRTSLIAPREPAIEAATDRTVGNVHYVAGGPQDNALAACVGAAALGDDAGNGAGVGADFRHFLAFAHLVDDNLFGPLASHFGRELF